MLRLVALLLVSVCAPLATAQHISSVPPPALPSARLPWSLDDVDEAAATLHALAQERPTALPRYSVSSRSVFGRLTSDGVLESDGDAQVAHLQHAVRTYEQILLIYARLQHREGGYDVEVAELARVMMRASAALAEAVTAQPVPEGDAAAFQAGVLRVRSGLTEMMRGVVLMAADQDALSLAARERLLLYARRESVAIAPLLPPPDRQALVGELTAAAEGAPSDEIAEAFRSLRDVYTR